MIGKSFKRAKTLVEPEVKGFDSFDMKLGDAMRGERATLGKSLLDVQRELKIKASYIAAIENADPDAFDTPGFIAGYVRSYARYLNMDPDRAFEQFCRESGFSTAHGMSAAASSRRPAKAAIDPNAPRDIFSSSQTPFIPASEAFLSRIEPGAVGSVMVLVALICGLGYGGWTVLQEVQRVQFAPVENAPIVVSDIDPLAGAAAATDADASVEQVATFQAPSTEELDRLYRPQALDVPVMVARDAPISTLNPASVGTLAPTADVESAYEVAELVAQSVADSVAAQSEVQVLETAAPGLQMVAVRPAWVRVRGADGSVLFEGIMNAGDTYAVPMLEEAPTLRVGESGAVYFAINGTHYGPAGATGTVTSNLPLSVDSLTQTYAVADITADNDLAKVVNVAQADTQ
ncbi:DUF4115 domain-containing protein [Marivivens sp. LCG002]|uniref:helix-turn-helix domain-containing protein n=1 Tax=Marivivens sp. LCG002 TaxID=3051171 RepID=UPI00255593EE|nr:helix-turn-helix domain-containing protein [Marivivens sp. LCG002]WIV51800.1 DUF4115 domain-containing protein [Marivivens sp. LCG002]